MEHLLFGTGVEAAAAVRQMMRQMGVAGAANANDAQRARFLWATMYAQDQSFKDFAPSQFGERLGGRASQAGLQRGHGGMPRPVGRADITAGMRLNAAGVPLHRD